MEKRCFKCEQVKPLDSFYKHPRMKDGRVNKCIECNKQDVIQNRLDKLEYYRSYDRLRASMPHRVAAGKEYRLTLNGKASHSKASKRWATKHPDRRKASHEVGNAIRDGKLKKLPCIVCGSEKVEGHHPDYSRPLDVVWLCVTHHKQAHALVKF